METGTQKKILLPFSQVFAYRSLWMAAAILMVVFSHIPVTFPAPLGALNFIREYCYVGVDIFLFASGIGCWFSLKKNPDPVAFLGRRAWSILPAWLIFLPFWLTLNPQVRDLTFPQVLANIFGTGFIGGLANQYNWYIGALWLCYLLCPFFAAFADRFRRLWQRGIILLVLLFFSLSFMGQYQLIMWSRLLIFFVGVCAAASSQERGGLSRRGFLISLGAMVLGIGCLWAHYRFFREIPWALGHLWYPCLFIAPGLCYLMSWLGSLVEKTRLKGALRIFMKLGKITFPLFLTHGFALDLFQEFIHRGYIQKNALGYLLGLISIVVFTAVLIGLEKAVKWGLKKLVRK